MNCLHFQNNFDSSRMILRTPSLVWKQPQKSWLNWERLQMRVRGCWQLSFLKIIYQHHNMEVLIQTMWRNDILKCLFNWIEWVNVSILSYGGKFSFSFRGRKALENRQNLDDDRISTLERMVRESRAAAEEAERKYDEVNNCQALIVFSRNRNMEKQKLIEINYC